MVHKIISFFPSLPLSFLVPSCPMWIKTGGYTAHPILVSSRSYCLPLSPLYALFCFCFSIFPFDFEQVYNDVALLVFVAFCWYLLTLLPLFTLLQNMFDRPCKLWKGLISHANNNINSNNNNNKYSEQI